MKTGARRAVLIAFQVVAVVALLEVALRAMRPFHDGLRVLLYMPQIRTEFDGIETAEDLLNHSVIGYRPHRVHSGFVLNSRGFRTPEYTASKAPGTWRVVAIGDSFTFASGGMPYSDMWVAVLERELQASREAPVEVIALGVPGVGPSFLRRLWQLEGSRIEPDTVVLAFFVGNDFTDQAPAVVEDAGTGLARWSVTARLVRNLARLKRSGVELPDEADPGPAPAVARGGYEVPGYRETFARRRPKLSREALIEMEARRAVICDRSETDAFEGLLRKTTRVIGSIDDEVAAAGAELLVLLIPDRFQIHADERAEILALLERREDEFDWERPQRRLREVLDREGIEYLDLLQPLRAAAADEVVYNPGDAHWSEAGNRVAGEALSERLRAPGKDRNGESGPP